MPFPQPLVKLELYQTHNRGSGDSGLRLAAARQPEGLVRTQTDSAHQVCHVHRFVITRELLYFPVVQTRMRIALNSELEPIHTGTNLAKRNGKCSCSAFAHSGKYSEPLA